MAGVKPWLAAVLVAVVCVSCKVGPDFREPQAKVAPQWTSGAGLTNRPFSAAEDYWWKNFNDEKLNQLVQLAWQNNPSLQAAGVNVLQARALLNQSVGNLFPQQQGFSGAAEYSRLKAVGAGVKQDYLADSMLFAADWEIDFWGKYRRGIESDRAAFLGSVAAYDNALVTLMADVASSYVNWRTLQERFQVAERNLDLQQESLRIARAQYRAGETSELDVRQAETQFAQTQAQLPALQAALDQTRNGLAVLLGETPAEAAPLLTGKGAIPAAPVDCAVGIPKDLLRRRPDVRLAGLAAASKCALIGVAKAAMYPSFTLSGDFGYQANNYGKSLVDMFNWQSRAVDAAAGVTFPIFNYGRLVNQVRVQDAQFQQALLNYQNVVLTAQAEVETGLSALANEQQESARLAEAATAARRSTALAVMQYKGGQSDYTTVLSAEQAQLAVEDALATARGGVTLDFIAVYRELGGGWQLRNGHDVVSDAVKAEMARRTDWGKLLAPSAHLPRGNTVAGQTD